MRRVLNERCWTKKTKDEVKEALKGIAAEMHNKMEKGVPPAMTLPVRSKQILVLTID